MAWVFRKQVAQRRDAFMVSSGRGQTVSDATSGAPRLGSRYSSSAGSRGQLSRMIPSDSTRTEPYTPARVE